MEIAEDHQISENDTNDFHDTTLKVQCIAIQWTYLSLSIIFIFIDSSWGLDSSGSAGDVEVGPIWGSMLLSFLKHDTNTKIIMNYIIQ